MGATTRHFKALMRKNFINWKRQPACSLCELFCPGLLMLVIVYIRMRIEPTSSDALDLSVIKHPLYPSFTLNEDGSWKDEFDDLTLKIGPFMDYDGYTGGIDPTQTDFDVKQDLTGPLAFMPSNCASSNSPVTTGQDSRYIGVIGEKNQIRDDLETYLDHLFTFQKNLPKAALMGLIPFEFKFFDNKEDFFAVVGGTDYFNPDNGFCFGFEIVEHADNDYEVKLYVDDQTLMGGAKGVAIPSQLQPSWNPTQNTVRQKNYEQYSFRGYSYLQNWVANIILKRKTNLDALISIKTVPMPQGVQLVDPFRDILTGILPLFLLLAYMVPVYNMVGLIVQEKDSKAKESMRMMGMTDLPYWLSWFVYYTIINTLISTFAFAILSINVFTNSSYGYVWLYLWLYGMAIFGQILILQSLFSNPKFSGILSTVIYFGGSILNFPVQGNTIPRSSKTLMSIIPQVASQQMAVVLGELETSGAGLDYEGASQVIENYTFNSGLWMMFIGLIVFSALGLYLDKVLPKTFGQRSHPCFCFMPRTYGCGRRGRVVDDDEQLRRSSLMQNQRDGTLTDDFEVKHLKKENYEPIASEIARLELENKFLQISELKKTYPNGFQAVKGINVKMYSGQIFALLGQNGAGKSTTISMLTGLLTKSDGNAVAYDKDVFEDMQEVRQFMGVCPQHDVLFEKLTPEEHMDIFYDFKGGNPETKQEEIRSILHDVGLVPDKAKMSASLSGGNKRKLSVALALCAGSKLVLLDEPTAGMDLSARRGLWDMLKNYRRDRIIILTTHYMDEADVLGDRIGIMAKGQLMCLGSSLFLKNRFGAGYKLTMVKDSKAPNTKIEPYLRRHFQRVEKLSEVSSEITYQIPSNESYKFKNFFATFDDELPSLGIQGYGISITTLEEVFLKINQEFQTEVNGEAAERVMDITGGKDENLRGSLQGPESPAVTQGDEEPELIKNSTFCGNIYAVLAKRGNIYKRDRGGLACEVIVPLIMVLAGCALTKIAFLFQSDPQTLSVDQFPLPQRMLVNDVTVVNSGAGNVDPMILYNNLPNVTDGAFEFNKTSVTNNVTYYDMVTEQQFAGDRQPYHYGSYLVYEADTVSNTYLVNSYINITSQDVTALYPQFMYESILKTATGDKDFKFKVTTEPYPILYIFAQRQEAGNALNFTFLVGIGLALVPCVMISLLLKERMDNLKHMQVVSGMSLSGYWTANLIADVTKTYIPLIAMIGLTFLFDLNFEGIWVLFLLFPLGIVPFTYITSFLFGSDTIAQIMTFFVHMLVSGVGSTTVFFLRSIPQTALLGDKLRWWFTLIPTYCVTESIVWSSSAALIIDVRNKKPQPGIPPVDEDLWALSNLTGNCLVLLAHFFGGLLILTIIETGVFDCIGNISFASLPEQNVEKNLDEDVVAEEKRVRRQTTGSSIVAEDQQALVAQDNELQAETPDYVRVCDFRKVYTTLFGKPQPAVERISFGLDFGECFALLGVNGAGKSTTFKSLTHDIVPTTGKIFVGGYNIQTQFSQARKLIGYCPQKDAIFNLMTVEEHIWFYARLRGIPSAKQDEIVKRTIKELNLSEYHDKLAGTLSGGNKRKLSVAIATIGDPPIILLDEPSAGMDPEARRFMWQVVAKISQRDKKSAVILTTHSMEEAEALSTKMGIMVRGGIFRCFGSSQHIKNKYGTGFEIEVKIGKPSYDQLKELAEKIGFVTGLEAITELHVALQQCQQNDVDELILQQVRTDGIGADLALEALQSGQDAVRLKNLMSYVFTQQYGVKVIEFLAKMFGEVELLEQCSDFFKFRVPRQDKTIGYLFGAIEVQKEECNISEYSVSQTSLEQIFQTFANLSIGDKAAFSFKLNALDQLILENPDRRSTMKQQRVSVKGLDAKPSTFGAPVEEALTTGAPDEKLL